MDVDTPNILKRCSSAPLINDTASTAATSPTTNTAPRSTSYFSMFSNNSLPRTRSNSISCSPLSAAINVIPSPCSRRLTGRVDQLRAEECADLSNTREVAHEREVHSAMQMGQSCEDLTLVGVPANSPTRVPRFSPVVSPSSTLKFTTRRSLSPIALRASSFSPVRPASLPGKRRCEDGDGSAPKRPCLTPRTPSTPPTPTTPDSDIDCTFRPVSPRPHQHRLNHKSPEPS